MIVPTNSQGLPAYIPKRMVKCERCGSVFAGFQDSGCANCSVARVLSEIQSRTDFPDASFDRNFNQIFGGK